MICPGGGYSDVWLDREGHDLAILLQKQGITSLVLKYRTSAGDRENRIHPWDTYLPAVEADARRAISILREQADELKLDPAKSASADSPPAATWRFWHRCFSPRTDNTTGVPNFAGLFYPWLRDDYSTAIEQNGAKIPPLFIMNAIDDRLTPVNKCVEFYAALLHAGVKAELHLYNQGGHGFDLGSGRGESTSMWPESFVAWLKDQEIDRVTSKIGPPRRPNQAPRRSGLAATCNADCRSSVAVAPRFGLLAGHTPSQAGLELLFSCSCNIRHITFPEPDFGSDSTNTTTRGTL